MLTNFHLPESTMTRFCARLRRTRSAACGLRPRELSALPFFSYGDAMFLIPKVGAGAALWASALRVATADGAARRGRPQSPRQRVETPAFMPVGATGAVKAMTPETW